MLPLSAREWSRQLKGLLCSPIVYVFLPTWEGGKEGERENAPTHCFCFTGQMPATVHACLGVRSWELHGNLLPWVLGAPAAESARAAPQLHWQEAGLGTGTWTCTLVGNKGMSWWTTSCSIAPASTPPPWGSWSSTLGHGAAAWASVRACWKYRIPDPSLSVWVRNLPVNL